MKSKKLPDNTGGTSPTSVWLVPQLSAQIISGGYVLQIYCPQLKLKTTNPSQRPLSTRHVGLRMTQEQITFSVFQDHPKKTDPGIQPKQVAECFRLGPRGGHH